MSEKNSKENRRRWKRKTFAKALGEKIRQSLRQRTPPSVRVGTDPDLRRHIPPEVTDLISTLTDECAEVVDCSAVSVHRNRHERYTLWRVSLVDGNAIALEERMASLAQGHGLHLIQVHSRPLPTIGGVSVVLFVSIAKENVDEAKRRTAVALTR